ncbi:hypothetical protein ACFFX1_05830 [Dactylosporangium sucinum]|uniref:Uncharacterized protein n=1 Tax=Dactylosporangium sucinum TaxID=1424081 RepID=A0A917UH79_9ACTN|nr:hypothetical protein [Dactylosporangium sucinum]GGM87324.1 hypothetical protein GCM10007977_106600 [Dactylosporangium sucinum]
MRLDMAAAQAAGCADPMEVRQVPAEQPMVDPTIRPSSALWRIRSGHSPAEVFGQGTARLAQRDTAVGVRAVLARAHDRFAGRPGICRVRRRRESAPQARVWMVD